MTTDTALIEKREELKRRLAAGEYKTLVDVFLEWFDHAIRKIIRQTKPLPLWLTTVILCLFTILIGLGAVYVAGDAASLRIVEVYGLGYGLGVLILTLSIMLIITAAIVINQFISRIFALWRDYALDATESLASLEKFEDWLGMACNRRLHFLVTIFAGLLGGLYVTSIAINLLGTFIGYGAMFGVIIGNMFTAEFFYLFYIIILLLTKLRQYELKLFATDPSNSELISRLSGELSFFVYFVAVFATIITLLSALAGVLQDTSIVAALFLWVPIISTFALNQISLSNIIRRVKWNTLNEAQARVEKLRTSKNFGNQETMDAIKRLMDYHDRVKATRDSALDFRTYLSFINSLLLPLLAFILGNLDLVLKLFQRKP